MNFYYKEKILGDDNFILIKVYVFKVNTDKWKLPDKYYNQIVKVISRIKRINGYLGQQVFFDLQQGYVNDDFVRNKFTLQISFEEPFSK